MKISSDYRDLLKSLNAAGVRYLVVGGYAVMIHTEPRYTKDLDIWVDRSADPSDDVPHPSTARPSFPPFSSAPPRHNGQTRLCLS